MERLTWRWGTFSLLLVRSLSSITLVCDGVCVCVCNCLCCFLFVLFACGLRALADAKLATSNPIHSTSAVSAAFSTATLNSPMRNQVPKVWIFNFWRPPAVDKIFDLRNNELTFENHFSWTFLSLNLHRQNCRRKGWKVPAQNTKINTPNPQKSSP